MARNAFFAPLISLGIAGGGAVLALLVDVILARTMGASDFGVYRYLTSIIILMSVIGSYGSSQYGIIISSNFKKLKGAFFSHFLSVGVCVFSITVIAGLLSIAVVVLSGGIVDFLYIAPLVFVSVLFRSSYIFIRAVLIGWGRFLIAQLADRLFLNTFLILFFVACYFSNIEINLSVALLAFSIALILSCFIVLLFFNAGRKAFVWTDKIRANRVRLAFTRLSYISASEIVETFIRIGVLVFAGAVMGFEDLAVLAILVRLYDLSGLISSSAASYFSPVISREIKSGIKLNGAKNAAKFTALVMFAVALLGSAFSSEIIGVFGEGYTKYSWLLVVVIWSGFFRSLLGPANTVLVFSGAGSVLFRINLINALILILGVFALGSFYGLVGVIGVFLFAQILSALLCSIVVYRNLNQYVGVAL